MAQETDTVYGGEERKELAYSMGSAAGKIPLSGIFVRPLVWMYLNVMLKIAGLVFSIVGKGELGQRLVADNKAILEELMAGFRGEEPSYG
jgi:hypothetical protein